MGHRSDGDTGDSGEAPMHGEQPLKEETMSSGRQVGEHESDEPKAHLGQVQGGASSTSSSSSRLSIKIPRNAVNGAASTSPAASSEAIDNHAEEESENEDPDQDQDEDEEEAEEVEDKPRRGRRKKEKKPSKKPLGRKRRGKDDSDESAYSEDSDEESSDSDAYSDESEEESSEEEASEEYDESEEEWDSRGRKYRKSSPRKGSSGGAGQYRSYVPPISIPFTYMAPPGYAPIQPLPSSMNNIPMFAKMRPPMPPGAPGSEVSGRVESAPSEGVSDGSSAAGVGVAGSPSMVRPPMMPMMRPSMGMPPGPPSMSPAQLQQLTQSLVANLAASQGTSETASATVSSSKDSTSSGSAGPTSPTEVVKSEAASNAPGQPDPKLMASKLMNDPEAKMYLMMKMRQMAMANMRPPGFMPSPGRPMMPFPGQPPYMPAGTTGGQYRPPPPGIIRQVSQQMSMPYYPMMSMRPPIVPRPPTTTTTTNKKKMKKERKRRRRGDDEEEDDDEIVGAGVEVDDKPIVLRRSRRGTTEKINYKKFLYEDEEEEDEEEGRLESDDRGGNDDEGIRAPKAPREKKERKPKAEPKQRRPQDGDGDADEQDVFGDEDFDSEGEGTPEEELEGVEKILSYRKTEDGEMEFYVKFHNKSYLHCEWIPEEELAQERAGLTRIRRFLSRPLSVRHYSDKHIFNPEFTEIDRVVTGWEHPDADDESKTTWSYLVKWVNLPYGDATWELKEDLLNLPDGEERIKDFENRPTLEYRRQHTAPWDAERPKPDSLIHLTESPIYKGQNTLFPYQLEGLNWLVHCWAARQSCIIADEMGLGKTVQSVVFLNYLYETFNIRGPFLVIAPLSTIPHWQREFESWTNLNVILYHGNIPSREKIKEYEFYYMDENDQPVPDFYKFDVLITTYEMAMAGFEHLQKIKWRAAVFDEAHRLKNKTSKASETLSALTCAHKVLLSGTPLQNNVEELFSLLNFMQPEKFPSEEAFLRDFGNLKKSEDVIRLQGMLKPLMLRRLKEDVEKSIPVKEETVIEVELTSIQKRYYRAILERNFAFLTKGCRGANAPNLINAMMELRKCCIHPYLIKGAEERILQESNATSLEEQMACMIQASGKLVLVDKLLKKLRENGHKVLIFSQMTRCLDLLSDYLRWRNYPHERIDGAVRGDLRQAAIDRFCNPENDSFVFLLCTRAGGVGINLTAADTVVIFDSDWNPQNDIQAQARCHRIGQTKAVKVYRLLTRNTYERDMFDKAGLKLGLDRAILRKMLPGEEDATLDVHNPQLSKGEVEVLLKKGAYGLLMENDDDAVKFCEEDIDQILERRTTVIRHEGGASADAAQGGSIFSKASFAVTSDAMDVDIDDPNFWEVWARRLNLDPRQLLSSSGVVVDEPRIKRQARRLRNTTLILKTLEGRLETDSAAYQPPSEGSKDLLWTQPERSRFLLDLFRFGIHRFDDMLLPHHPQRSKNDLIACTRATIKLLLEAVEGEEDGRFREDCEKLLLAHLDFDRSAIPVNPSSQMSEVMDESTGRIDIAAAEMVRGDADGDAYGDEIASVSERSFTKADIPFSGASRQQIIEYRSFIRELPADLVDALKADAKVLLLRIQLMDFIRQLVESHSNVVKSNSNSNNSHPPHPPKAKKRKGAAATGDSLPAASIIEYSLPIPHIIGSAPMRGWSKSEDEAMIVGIYRHGFGRFDVIRTDPTLIFSTLPHSPTIDTHAGDVDTANSSDHRKGENDDKTDWPSEESLEDRLKKVVLAMEKKTQAAAKLAIQAANSAERGPRRKVRLEDGDEMYEQDDDDYGPVAGGSRRRVSGAALNGPSSGRRSQRGKKVADATPALSTRWSKKDRGEFQRVVLAFGLPPLEDGEEDPMGSRDWSGFKALAEFSGPIQRAGDRVLEEYCRVFVKACKAATEKRGRRKIADDDDYAEGEDGDVSAAADTGSSLPTIPVERAKKALSRIEMFEKLRQQILVLPDLESYLERARKASGFPTWWESPAHDVALLKAVAKHGIGNWNAMIIDEELPFREIYFAVHPEYAEAVAKATEAFRQELADAGAASEDASPAKKRRGRPRREKPAPTMPAITDPPIDPNLIDWPQEALVTRRLEALMEMISNEERRRGALAVDDASVSPESASVANSATKKRRGRAAKAPSDAEAADDMISPAATTESEGKRRRTTRAAAAATAKQRTMADFVVKKGKATREEKEQDEQEQDQDQDQDLDPMHEDNYEKDI